MEVTMIAEAEQIEFKTLAFNHFLARNITDTDLCKVRLSGDRTQRSELRTIEPDPVVIPGCLLLNVSNTSGA